MTKQYEIHFQDGFEGDTYSLLVSGKKAGSGRLTTRNQIGLAEIVKFEAAPGKELTLKLPEAGETTVLKLPKTETYLRVNKVNSRIATEWAEQSPGYV